MSLVVFGQALVTVPKPTGPGCSVRWPTSSTKFGYRGLRAHSLKPKHVEALVAHWQAEELTGWKAPAVGGPASKALTTAQKLDRDARLTISRALGHEREQITAVYLGR